MFGILHVSEAWRSLCQQCIVQKHPDPHEQNIFSAIRELDRGYAFLVIPVVVTGATSDHDTLHHHHLAAISTL
jgi:hypothetical protein